MFRAFDEPPCPECRTSYRQFIPRELRRTRPVASSCPDTSVLPVNGWSFPCPSLLTSAVVVPMGLAALELVAG